MLIASARTAASLAAAIDAVNAQITQVNACIANSAIITGGSLDVNDPVRGIAHQTIQTLSSDESATVFNSMLTILSARLTTWNAALAALS